MLGSVLLGLVGRDLEEDPPQNCGPAAKGLNPTCDALWRTGLVIHNGWREGML